MTFFTPNTSRAAPGPQGSPMLEWTGERYLPWIQDAAIAYEHFHRYVFASRLTNGKHVLDLASGEGYGANMLAQTAASVVGVDIAEAAVQHARQKYARGNLNYLSGSITSIRYRKATALTSRSVLKRSNTLTRRKTS